MPKELTKMLTNAIMHDIDEKWFIYMKNCLNLKKMMNMIIFHFFSKIVSDYNLALRRNKSKEKTSDLRFHLFVQWKIEFLHFYIGQKFIRRRMGTWSRKWCLRQQRLARTAARRSCLWRGYSGVCRWHAGDRLGEHISRSFLADVE